MSEVNTYAVSFEDVVAAQKRIAPYVNQTPILRNPEWDNELGVQFVFKAEHLRKGSGETAATPSFKDRGATNALLVLRENIGEEIERGVVTFSSGNHVLALAQAGLKFGIPVTALMAESTPPRKIRAALEMGATVITEGVNVRNRDQRLEDYAGEHDLAIVHAFNDPNVIAGQGTVALELFEQAPDIEGLYAPVGGGGLVSGILVAARGLGRAVRVVGVEPSDANDAQQSLWHGQLQSLQVPSRSVCDAVLTTQLGANTWPIIRDNIDDIVAVDEDRILEFHRRLMAWPDIGGSIEPVCGMTFAAAAEIGALFAYRDTTRLFGNIAIILSGGNC